MSNNNNQTAASRQITHFDNRYAILCSIATFSDILLLNSLPTLRDTPVGARKPLLVKKLRLCTYVFQFDESVADIPDIAKDKEVKRSTLLELVNYLTVFKPQFAEDELASIFEMLAVNLFRPLPLNSAEASVNNTYQYNPEEDEPLSESSW